MLKRSRNTMITDADGTTKRSFPWQFLTAVQKLRYAIYSLRTPLYAVISHCPRLLPHAKYQAEAGNITSLNRLRSRVAILRVNPDKLVCASASLSPPSLWGGEPRLGSCRLDTPSLARAPSKAGVGNSSLGKNISTGRSQPNYESDAV